MSAKEMFEKLGYKQVDKSIYLIEYCKFVPATDENNLSGYDWENHIKFGNLNVYSDKFVNIELLQAINKQVEELGWNNE